GFGAEMILYCTSVPGVYDDSGKIINQIDVIDKHALSLAKKEKSSVGLGGMTSKLTFARLATQMGIKAVIFGIKSENAIINAVAGKTGTVCLPQEVHMSARRKW